MNTYQRELTDKQRKFCDLYLSGLNATRAALQAGYSRGTAENGRLMSLPLVREYLKEHQSARSAGDVKVNAERVLAELCKVAFANVADCFNTDGSMKAMDDIDPDTMAGIESISFSDKGAVKIKMFNKMQALEKIAKRIAFYMQPAAGVESAPAVIAGEHPDFVDDSFDVEPAIAEMEDYMSGKTGDDPTEEEVALAAERERLKAEGDFDAGSCLRSEPDAPDAWIGKTFARELEVIRAERKLVAV